MLKNLWSDPSSKFAFSGVSKIKQIYGSSKKVKEIENELSENRTYTRHKEAKKIKNFNPFFVYDINDMWQIDLMYLPDLSKYNEGYKYLLCVIEVFTRKLYIKILKDKTCKIVTNAFIEIQEKINIDVPEVFFRQPCKLLMFFVLLITLLLFPNLYSTIGTRILKNT